MAMKRFVRIFGVLAVLLTAALLAGCHAMYPITVNVSGSSIDDEFVDILLPIDEDDTDYLMINDMAGYVLNMEDTGVMRTELYSYCDGGYRSMLIHHGLSDYRITHGSNTAEVNLYLNGQKDFTEMCDKYRTFKIALVDRNGNILDVSEKFDLSTYKGVYVDKINYDRSTGRFDVSYLYNRSLLIAVTEAAAETAMLAIPMIAVLGLAAIIIIRTKEKGNIPNIAHSLLFLIPLLPLVLYIVIRIDYAVKTAAPLSDSWTDFTALSGGNILMAAYRLLPVPIFIAVTVWAAINRKKQ